MSFHPHHRLRIESLKLNPLKKIEPERIKRKYEQESETKKYQIGIKNNQKLENWVQDTLHRINWRYGLKNVSYKYFSGKMKSIL